ncbi:MAG: serine hydrolase [Clostridiaceae bacterium]|nr:serine hydrolase [Clostridiaceae bacterium]
MKFLPRTTPESVGIRSSDILRFIERLSENEPFEEPHGFLLLRHGQCVAEGYFAPFTADSRHSLFSVSKSIISTAIGFAVQENLLTLEDRIADFFPEYLPQTSAPAFSRMTIRHILMMATGQQGVGVHMTLRGVERGIPEAFFRASFLDEPGQTFRYSSAATYMLSLLIARLTGQDVVEYLTPRLFQPLGIEPPFARRCPDGIILGYTGMRMTLRELALFGQFYLQRGMWEGRQLLDAAWFDLATQKQIDTGESATGGEWSQGYCFQFWRGTHNTFRFCGAHGQMCIVSPDRDLVCVLQSGYDNRVLQYVVDAFYSTIWDGMDAAQSGVLPEDPDMRKRLEKTLAGLMLPTVSSNFSPLTSLLNGAVYTSDNGDIASVSIRFSSGVCLLTVTYRDGAPATLASGMGRPMEAVSTLADHYSIEPADKDPTQSYAYWEATRELRIVARVVPTPTVITAALSFRGDDTLEMHLRSYRGECDDGYIFTGKRRAF